MAAFGLTTRNSPRESRCRISRSGVQMRRSCITSRFRVKIRSRVAGVGFSKTSTWTSCILSSIASRFGK